MESFAELCAYARGRFAVIASEDSRLELRPDDGPLVGVELIGIDGKPWVVVDVPACQEQHVPARDVLIRNAELAVGALCLFDGWLVLRAAAPLSEVSAPWLERSVLGLAHEAIDLARWTRAVATVESVYAMYAR